MSDGTHILNVDLGSRSYPIYIGEHLIARPEIYKTHISSKQVLVVTNTTIAPLYLDVVVNALDSYQVETVVLPDGEEYKTINTLDDIFTSLLNNRFDRGCTLIALGGGVIGDMTGFASACYQRGVDFVQIPTTLLSQVDSSVGGKTGVNHSLGKNMIGAFYQPKCVIADICTLATLDDRQLSAGLAEIIKYGLLGNLEFFKWLELNIEKLMNRDDASLALAVEKSCLDKAKIVAEDEKEAGKRALLNLGHTFGHAIETGMGYGEWLHGEAISAGMSMAARFSVRLGWLKEDELKRIDELLVKANLPIEPPKELSAHKFLELMSVDKKVLDGELRLILMRGIGQSEVTSDFESQFLEDMLNEYH